MIDNPTRDEEKQYGMFIHLAILAITVFSGGTLGAICAIIVYLYYKKRDFFLREVAADSLNIQLSGLLYGIVIAGAGVISGLLVFTGSGKALALTLLLVALFFALGLYFFVAHIMCALRARRGELYRPPLMIKFIK